jgi:hypothetical protein
MAPISTANSGRCPAYSVLLRRTKAPMMPGMSDEEVEEIIRLDGDDMDLKQLARSFPTGPGPVRVEKHGDSHYLFRQSEGSREDSEVLADGADTLAEMNAIMLAGDPAFRPPTIGGISQKLPDGTFRTIRNATVQIQSRTAMFPNVRLIGPDGKVIENKGPTEDQIVLELAAKHEPFRRALIIFGTSKHDWGNLYKVLDAMRDGHGGLSGLKSKNFVPARDIDNFKETANSPGAIGLEAARRGSGGSSEPKMTLVEAQEMFRKLFQGWIQELRDRDNS